MTKTGTGDTRMDPLPYHHIDQFRAMMVRVKPDARQLYEGDWRWTAQPEDIREIGMTVLEKIQGQVFPVTGVTRMQDDYFYQLPVKPPMVIETGGLPLTVNTANVPHQYVDIISHGFWEAD